MSKRRVVVTGIGILSSLGHDIDTSWSNIVAGKSGAASISDFDTTAFTTRISASVKNFDVSQYMSEKSARKMDLFLQYGMVAAIQAFNDANLNVDESNSDRIGVMIGSGIGGLGSIEKSHTTLVEQGPRRVSPFFVPSSIINMVSGNISIMYGLHGPNTAVSTACTTGTHNIGLAARMIKYGDADVMLCGGTEMATTPLGLGGFGAARALSTRNEAPTEASRPWDEGRDGFVLGDGAGVLVLEELETAKARNAHIYAELVGYGMSGDAHHVTSPPEQGTGAALAMGKALKDAQLEPQEIGYINAHGTSTPVGDLAEANAIKHLYGNNTKQLCVSSTKSMTGHLLGAAGAIEAIFTILALRDQVAPPTINLYQPSLGCDLNFVPHTAQDCKIQAAMSNSFGFGGTNASLVFAKI